MHFSSQTSSSSPLRRDARLACAFVAMAAPPIETLCMAAADCTCNFAPLKLKRRAMNPFDVVIDMRFCGVCHSDVHIAQGMVSVVAKVAYPIVPGHELAGVVSAVGASLPHPPARAIARLSLTVSRTVPHRSTGSQVTKFKVRLRAPDLVARVLLVCC